MYVGICLNVCNQLNWIIISSLRYGAYLGEHY